MAIWIDENAYLEACDDNKLYEYLYHLVLMLAHQHKYFNRVEYYDEFGLYSASKLFMRLRNPKQFIEDDARALYKIKSILNYIKTVIYPYKVDFEQDYYAESPEDETVLYTGSQEIGTFIADESDICNRIDFEFTLDNIYIMSRRFLSKIPCNKENYEWYNIYCSCMLTLLDSITPVESANPSNQLSTEQLNSIVKDLDRDPTLFHLNSNMSNYIKVLVRELRHFLAEQLTIESHSYTDAESMTKSMIIATLQEEE